MLGAVDTVPCSLCAASTVPCFLGEVRTVPFLLYAVHTVPSLLGAVHTIQCLLWAGTFSQLLDKSTEFFGPIFCAISSKAPNLGGLMNFGSKEQLWCKVRAYCSMFTVCSAYCTVSTGCGAYWPILISTVDTNILAVCSLYCTTVFLAQCVLYHAY